MLISKEFVFQRDDKKYGMKISKNSINQILHHCQNASPNETGGIMAGYYSEDLRWAIVTDISGPTADSVLKRCSFYRGIQGLQKWLDSKWKKRKHHYLGEWHFHPFASAIPSKLDDIQMTNFANNRSLKCPEPILLIIGGNPERNWSMKPYVYLGKEKHELKIVGSRPPSFFCTI